MDKIKILKSFLEDDIIKEKYGISQKDVDTVALTPVSSNVMIAFLQNLVMVIEDDKYTVNTAASNLNTFLENKLR